MTRIATRTPENLPDGWYETLYDAAAQGASKLEMATLLGLPERTFYKMRKDYPEFDTAIQELAQVAQVWWERQGRSLVTGDTSGNATAFIFQMKNRFPQDYRDRKEIDHQSTDGTLTPVSKVTIEVIDATQNQSDQATS
jgi:hypothetical protein